MTVKRLGGDMVWVACPAFGDPTKVVIGKSRRLVLGEIGVTERKFEYGKKRKGREDGKVDLRGKDGTWVVFRTDLLRVVRPDAGNTEYFKGKR